MASKPVFMWKILYDFHRVNLREAVGPVGGIVIWGFAFVMVYVCGKKEKHYYKPMAIF